MAYDTAMFGILITSDYLTFRAGNKRLFGMGKCDEQLAFIGPSPHHRQVQIVVHAPRWIENHSRSLQRQRAHRFRPAPVGANHDAKETEIRLVDAEVTPWRVLVVMLLEVQLVISSNQSTLSVDNESGVVCASILE